MSCLSKLGMSVTIEKLTTIKVLISSKKKQIDVKCKSRFPFNQVHNYLSYMALN